MFYTAPVDFVIRNARVAGELVDIGFQAGRIAAIRPDLESEADSYDAGGRLASAGLIESHIHLDKSRIIDRCEPQERAKLSPIIGVAPLKKTMTVEDVHERAERTLLECVKHGTTRMRTQLEVDPGIGMRGFEAIASLIEEYRWAIDVEICAFPQEGLTNYEGTDELLVEALRRGAKVVGGAPRYDTDGAAQVERIFQLAREFDVDIDIHLDVGPTTEGMFIYQVLELTEKYKRGGRVVAGHMAKLSLMPPDEATMLGRRIADAGVAVTVLPATDLFLMGRDQEHSVRRGVADANLLLEAGVNCSLSSNNILNPATPYGDCSLLRIANLYANILQLDRPAQLEQCFDMLTERSARVLGLTDYGLKLGNPADVVIFDAESPKQAVAEISQPLAVFKGGRQTVRWQAAELLLP